MLSVLFLGHHLERAAEAVVPVPASTISYCTAARPYRPLLQAAGQVAVAVRLERPLLLHLLEQPRRLGRLLQVEQTIADQPQGIAAAGVLLDDARQHVHRSVHVALPADARCASVR